MSDSHASDDKEKGYDHEVGQVVNAPDDAVIVNRFARYGKLGSILQKVFASGVEARGVERVPENEREYKNMWNKYVLCSDVQCICTMTLNLDYVAC